MIATSTPEMFHEGSQKKVVWTKEQKICTNQGRLFIRGRRRRRPICRTDGDMDMDEDWFAVEPDHFVELFRLPVLDDYVLVEFKTRSQSKFYVGRITKMKDDEGDYEVKFLRYRKYNTFVEPPVDDIASVNGTDIKMLLENPSVAQCTKRRKSFISFGVDFSNLNIG